MSYDRKIRTMCKGESLCLPHQTTSWPLVYVYMCICAWTVFPVHLSAKQIHSRWVQVHKKPISSTILVSVCGLFFPFEVALSYKGESCLQVTWEVHNSLAFFCLKVTPGGAGLMTRWTWKSLLSVCQVKMCWCELSLWGTHCFVT